MIEHNRGTQVAIIEREFPLGYSAVELLQLSDTSWRVCDCLIAEDDASRLLGYIEHIDGDRFEVLWLAPSVRWAYVDTFQRALEGIADPLSFSGSVQLQPDSSSTPSAVPPPRFG